MTPDQGAPDTLGEVALGGAAFGRAAVAVATTRIALVVLGTAASIVIARTLGPDGRGRYAFAVAIAATAIALAHASVEQAQVYAVSQGATPRHLAANAMVLGLALGGLAIGVVLLGCLATGYPVDLHNGATAVLLALVGIPLSIIVLYTNGLLVLEGRTDLLNRGGLIAGVGQCALLVALAGFGRLTVTAVVVAWLINAALPLVVSVRHLHPHRADLSRALLRSEVSIGLRYHTGLSSLYLLLRVDILLVAAFRGDREVGLYALAVGLVELTNVATDSLATVVLRRQATSSLADAAVLTARVTGFTAALAIVAAGGLVAVSHWLIPVVYGRAFTGAVPALFALAPGVLALAATRTTGAYLVRLNRPWLVTAITGCAMALNVLLNVVLIPAWGIVGAGVASSVAYALLAMAYLAWFRRAAGLPWAAFATRQRAVSP